jgi:hypothetical protein
VVVESARWARQTSPPRPWSIKTAKKSLGRRALPFRTRREPEQLPGPFRRKTRGARIRKDGPPTAREERKLLDPTTKAAAQVFAGVDVSEDRLDVCLRWSEPERHNDEEEAFVATYDDSGIDALVSRLLKERPELVILERPPAALNGRWSGLWPR